MVCPHAVDLYVFDTSILRPLVFALAGQFTQTEAGEKTQSAGSADTPTENGTISCRLDSIKPERSAVGKTGTISCRFAVSPEVEVGEVGQVT
jgi:hypothetical protein